MTLQQTVPGLTRPADTSPVHREAVVAFDGRVIGYTVTLTPGVPRGVPTPHTSPEQAGAWLPPSPTQAPAAWQCLEEQYLSLDLPALVADRYAFLPASSGMLDGLLPVPHSDERVVLDLPAEFERRIDAARRASALRSRGVRLCLNDYRGDPAQDALLPLLAFVTIDRVVVESPASLEHLERPGHALAGLVARAHQAGVKVLAPHSDALSGARCRTAGVDAIRGGPTAPAPPSGTTRVLRAGQLQCLAAMHLLHQPDLDLPRVGDVIDTDPVLTLRVLHLVNSGAFALRREVDTVQQAVVLLGPRELTTLVAALALDARLGAMDSLWRILTRALTCEQLAEDAVGYTVGLLSGLIEELGVPAELVLAKVGVSAAVQDAITKHAGDLGRALAAVQAHEDRDYAAVLRLGLAPMRVSEVYLRCLANGLATARAVSPS